ncbi:AzlC family ABC transporter permease [Amaricoccus solimangrovi]|uniref:Branched-chain amino acid ABC transporter permease n=1 Tax=Amaricoccus solimangrovi TaxID=2589815 RepID=A0A501WQ44_9RHOB|nr:AzlC family ABC transporter permease [Amaricoccus solimangrovi]TPE49357.1 branched-chain amino acid ABC transporter permease [Amaricoccus solimangrovi]
MSHRNWSAFRLGLREGLPFVLVIIPFGALFGVAATEAGWSLAQSLSMSIFVIAGASQFTALQLLGDHAPLAIVILTSLAVNLRMAMYSASLAPLLGAQPFWKRAIVAYLLVDQTYGLVMANEETGPRMTPAERIAYFLGTAAAICPWWYAASIFGAVAGTAIPAALALDFAVPITFIALFAPALRSLPHIAAAFVSVAAALAFAAVPYNLGLLIAAALAMVTGALVETLLERRRAEAVR